MIPGSDHWYACVAEPTPGMLRWDVARNRCRDRNDLYRALGRITETMHMTKIKSAEGAVMAGPDEPALARATGAEEVRRATNMMLAGSAGSVAPAQAGILPTGGIRVTDEMVQRAFAVAQGLVADRGLEPGDVRAILEAALRG